jgi:hypothetical protein
VRLAGTSKNTVLKLLLVVGELATVYQDHKIQWLTCKRIQCDET